MVYKPLKNPTTFIIKKQVIRVEKLVGQRNKFKDIAFKSKVKLQERIRREESERKIESPARGVEKFISNRIPTPKLGFLDVIKNFLFSVLFGALTLKLLPHLPKLKGLLITTLRIGNFGIEFAGTILNAMATFVDKAYGVIDFGKKQAKLLGGDTGVANYEKMLGMANKIMNSMLIAGMIFSDLVESDANASAGQQATEFIKDRVVQQAGQRAAQQAAVQGAARLTAAGAAAVVGGVGLLSSALGEGAFQLRKFTTKIEKDAYKGLSDAQSDPNPFTRFVKTAFYNAVAIPGMRFYNFLLGGVGTLLDVVGAPFRYAIELINYGVMFLQGDTEGMKKQKENLGKFDARIREQIREIVNTLSFGTIAKNKGSFGSLFGDEAVKAMGYASGGQVTRGGELSGGAIGRTEVRRTAARTIDIPMSPLVPGSDVGGLAPYSSPATNKPSGYTNIETFFPNPQNPRYVNSFYYLTQSYKISSSGRFLKPFLQMPIKIIMGDGASSADAVSLAAAINNLFNNILSNVFVPGKKKTLADEIGPVDILGWASRKIQEIMMAPLEDLKTALAYQFTLKSGSGGAAVSPSAQKGPGAGDNPLAQFGGEAQFVIGDSIARGFAGLGSTPGTDADDSKNGRSPEAVLAILKARGDKLKGVLIDLSTGIANNPSQFDIVEQQLNYLKSIGVRVRILGVANKFSKDKGGINEKLSQMASKYGFYFYGGYKGGADGLHATPQDYSDIRSKRDQTISAADKGGLSGMTGKGSAIYLHWTAGSYGGVSGNYHTTITGDGKINRTTPYDKFNVDHTYKRNSNAVGLSVAAMGGSPDPWSIPVKPIQYQKMAEEAARIAKAWGWTASDINIKNVMTHAEAGANKDGTKRHDNYGPRQWGGTGERWDLFNLYKNDAPGSGGDKIRSMIRGMMFNGGYVNETGNYETHPGEYVIDADSVKLFGVPFYDIINKTETVGQRKRASENLISILSQYTEDGFPETEDDYTYEVPQSQIVMMPPQVIPFGAKGGGYSGGESDDPSLDFTELR